MNVYIYNADIFCEECAEEIKNDIRSRHAVAGNKMWPGKPPAVSSDSSEWPNGPHSDGGGEADCPQHCGRCGEFLQNPLTADGYEYVRQAAKNPDSECAAEWAEYYGIKAD